MCCLSHRLHFTLRSLHLRFPLFPYTTLFRSGDGTIDNPGDMKVIGNSTPRYEYGFRIGADFKGFDLGVFFQGVAKRDLWGAGFLAIPGFHASDGAMPEAIVSNYWRPDHTDAFYPPAFNNSGAANVNNMKVQSRYI